MPVAKTKKELQKMNSGDILIVKGDFGEAAENIKRYVEKHGGEIVNHKVEGDNYYLKIRKL
jgi:TusA-related sulfurtransferase